MQWWYLVSVAGATEEHFPGLLSSSDQSESSSGENNVVDGGSQDLSHSEQDDSSEKMGLISEAASPPGSPEQPPDLALAISNWVQFEDDATWASTSPPHKETGETGRRLGRVLIWYMLSRLLFRARVNFTYVRILKQQRREQRDYTWFHLMGSFY
jgi:hypothetical protein